MTCEENDDPSDLEDKDSSGLEDEDLSDLEDEDLDESVAGTHDGGHQPKKVLASILLPV